MPHYYTILSIVSKKKIKDKTFNCQKQDFIMKYRGVYFLIICVHFFFPADAHVPVLVDDNENIENAVLIEDPLKSWALYDELDAGEVHYYRFFMNKGQSLSISLFVPKTDEFTPSLAIMGPGIRSNIRPIFLEIPGDSGVLILEGELPGDAIYEPFTPTSHYKLAEIALNIEEAGTYYVAVYDQDTGGRYGLAIGSREEFELLEWIMVPFNVIRIHKWEGQSLAFILSPTILVVIIGLFFIYRKKRSLGFFSIIGSFAGLLYIGSGAAMLIQMFIALSSASFTLSVFLTLVFVLVSILVGIAILHISFQDDVNNKARVKMVILGIIGLFAWAGILIGPLSALIAGILPSYDKINKIK